MNAVEKLEAAIEKLETLKAESTPGPWVYGGQGWLFGGKSYTDGELHDLFGQVSHIDADGDLIVTLHRTIDAQLAILRDAANVASEIERLGLGRFGWGRAINGITLASAILGEA